MMKFLMFMMSYMLLFLMFKSKILKILHNLIFLFLFFYLLNYLNFNFFSYIYWKFSFDTLSYSLILLNIWILILSMMANFNFLKKINNINFFFILMFLMIFMNLYFISMNLFMFYFFFESSLIPIILLILGWGYQIDRVQASIFMLFYTLFGSLPLIIMINYIYFMMNCISMNLLFIMNNYINFNIMLFIFSISAFLVKMPMYLLHLWLPKAHVESPVSGSMILAGTMLKLGSYGIIRFMIMFKNMFFNYSIIIMILSLWGSILCCLICLNMNDIKVIIAYSSIIHMGLLLTSMLTFYYWGFLGSIMMMIAHGICSPALFYLMNLNYEKLLSRNMNFNKGLINIIPNLSMWWFLVLICNMSAPLTLNLLSEIMLLNSLIYFNFKFLLLNMILIFFSSLYNIYMYYFIHHGKNSNLNLNFKMLNIKENLLIFLHWMPLNFFFFNLNFFN